MQWFALHFSGQKSIRDSCDGLSNKLTRHRTKLHLHCGRKSAKGEEQQQGGGKNDAAKLFPASSVISNTERGRKKAVKTISVVAEKKYFSSSLSSAVGSVGEGSFEGRDPIKSLNSRWKSTETTHLKLNHSTRLKLNCLNSWKLYEFAEMQTKSREEKRI